MGFELLDLLFVFVGIYLAIMLVYIMEAIKRRKNRPDEETDMRLLALTEGVLWLGPVINFTQKCTLLLKDFRNGEISDQELASAWPKINLKELRTEQGKASAPWLPAGIFQKGMSLIASLDYIIPLLPSLVLNNSDMEERREITDNYITRLSNLHESFLALDLELRNLIAEIGREKK